MSPEPRDRTHELWNALTAVEGAALTLEREGPSLNEHDRAVLLRILLAGVARIREALLEDRDRGAG